MRLERLNFTEEVRHAAGIVEQLAPAVITVHTDITEMTFYILGRKGMAEHILMNLCKNAFQAMEKTERKELAIELTGGHEKLVLRVRDTGCGISEDAQQKIFEPFYTTKGSRHGTGLGLSVVRNILGSIGGTIRVESTLGEGTCFIMEIPLCEEGDADSPKRLKPISRIAFVVREERQKTWKAVVRSSEKTIDFYGHPAALIDRIQKTPASYELVIAEYTLPTMNGIELCEVIRRLNPEIRLILLVKQGGADYEWYLNNGMIDRFILTSDFEKEFPTL